MEIFDRLSGLGHEQVVFCQDKATGLKAIIAIHDTTLGPSLGGCRLWPYASDEAALFDVLRLSRGMTYKNAVAGLSLGGGKAVIIGDPKTHKSEALFRAFGRFVQGLGGRYVTAEDVNINPTDMGYVATETRYVAGLNRAGSSGDPSPVTALGVFHGIRAGVRHGLGRDDLRGVRVAIQGIGSVGRHLAERLAEAGAKLTLADIDEERAKALAPKVGGTVVRADAIHGVDVDVFAPCALGAILNDDTIPAIKAKVIAGGANNQLLDEVKHGAMVQACGLVYAPDYVINAGGVINIFHELKGYDPKAAHAQAAGIYDTLLTIFAEAKAEGIATSVASARLAERRLAAVRAAAPLRHHFDNQPWIHRS